MASYMRRPQFYWIPRWPDALVAALGDDSPHRDQERPRRAADGRPAIRDAGSSELQEMSSPDGQVSGTAVTEGSGADGGGVVARCHPDDLPEGYHTVSERQSCSFRVPTWSNVAARQRRDRAAPGRRDGRGIRRTRGAVSWI